MAEPIFKRVQRVVAAGLETAADAAERVSGSSMMRHAVRELDQSIGKLEMSRGAALARRTQAGRQQQAARKRLTQLADDARFAIGKGRDDLAEAAVAQQLDHEAELERLKGLEAEASAEAARLEEKIAELKARKSQMEKDLVAVESARREFGAGGSDARVDRKVKRAADVFDRTARSGSVVSMSPAQPSPELDELDTIRRSAMVADRLAALKTDSKAKGMRAEGRPKKR